LIRCAWHHVRLATDVAGFTSKTAVTSGADMIALPPFVFW
jgi:hypothetical protein